MKSKLFGENFITIYILKFQRLTFHENRRKLFCYLSFLKTNHSSGFAMFQSISIKNYKSIQSLPDFELKPINVLIGANNSGKSNFLDVFAFLRDTLQDGSSNGNHEEKVTGGWRGALEKRGGGESICFNNEQHFQISCLSHPINYSLRIALDQSIQDYRAEEEFTKTNPEGGFRDLLGPITILSDEDRKRLGFDSKDGHTGLYDFYKRIDGEKQALIFAKQLSEIKIYDRIHTEIWSPIRTPKISKGETILDEDGGNLVGVLHQLSQTQPGFLSELNSLLKALFRDFSQISFPSNSRGELLIRWEDTTGRIIHTSQLSDGTLKFLCLITILKNPNPPALIGLDEPDAKLHPKMQVILENMIDEASQRMQIIATTHNPDFVSMFTPDEIVIVQQYMGATEMRRFSSKGALELWLEHFTTRKLWLMGELESRW